MLLKNIFFTFLLTITFLLKAEEPGIFAFNVSKKDLKDFCVGFGIGASHGALNQFGKQYINKNLLHDKDSNQKSSSFINIQLPYSIKPISYNKKSNVVLMELTTLAIDTHLTKIYIGTQPASSSLLWGKGIGQFLGETIQPRFDCEGYNKTKIKLTFNLSLAFAIVGNNLYNKMMRFIYLK